MLIVQGNEVRIHTMPCFLQRKESSKQIYKKVTKKVMFASWMGFYIENLISQLERIISYYQRRINFL